MRKLLRGLARPSTYLPIILLTIFGYAVSINIIPKNTLAIMINGLFVAVWAVIILAYGPSLIRSLRSDHVKQDQYLISGILLMWTAIALSRLWSLALIMVGKPAWMLNHWFQTFCYLAAACSGFYFLNIPGGSERGYRYTSIVIALSIMLGTAVLAFFEV